MLHCRLLSKIIFILSFFPLPLWAGQFLVGTEDVPLMNGMEYCQDETFSFDSEDGRLYFSKTFVDADFQVVKDFYDDALFQLGWQKNQEEAFEREGDVLRIAVVDREHHSGRKTTVIFELITKTK